jgi:hypothetical protein
MSVSNPNRPRSVTKKLVRVWQPYVDKMIRRFIHHGTPQLDSVDRALDLRDDHIKAGHRYRNGKIIK